MPQDGAPSSTSVDVLAAQVRKELVGRVFGPPRKRLDAALDALVALVKEWQDATERAIANGAGNVDRLHERINELKAERDALVARVTAAERRAEYWNAATKATAGEYQSSRAALADARNALEQLIREAVKQEAEWADSYWEQSMDEAREALRLARAGDVEGVIEILDRGYSREFWSAVRVAREVLARLDGSQS